MTEPDPISISVVVCTRNRAASLAQMLPYLAALDLAGIASFELVMVDNGSTDNTAAVIAAFANDAPFPVQCVVEPRAGLSRARNAGVRAASGEIILFTDDDCLVSPDWVRVAAAQFEGHPLQVVGGRVELFNKAHLELTILTSLERRTAANIDDAMRSVIGANMAFGRAVFDRLGLFDTRLGAGTPAKSGEDTELLYRAFSHGIPVTYEPSLCVLHNHGRVSQEEKYVLLQGYMLGFGGLLGKYILKGQRVAAQVLYWELSRGVRSYQAGKITLSDLGLVFTNLLGALRFIALDSWRTP
jgi:glycosyltransferase involved in cell wall biosynthesis